MLTAKDVRTIAKRQAARDRLSYSKEDLEDVTQDTILALLEYLNGQEAVEEDDLLYIAETTARKAWKRVRAENPIRLGEHADTLVGYLRPVDMADTEIQDEDRPDWIPTELWPVARLVASGWNNSEIARELGYCEKSIRKHRKRLALLPVPFKQYATAQGEKRRAQEALPAYSYVGSTPKSLGDIPPLQERPDCGDDQVNLRSDRPDELGKAIWEGLTAVAFAVSTPHGLRHDCRLRWGETWATCGRGSAASGM